MKVPLVRIHPDAQPVELPFRGFQFTLSPHVHSVLDAVTDQDIVSTTRSDKGFGSTNEDFKKRMLEGGEDGQDDAKKRKCDAVGEMKEAAKLKDVST